MNPLQIIALIPTILRIVDFAKRILTQGLSINSLSQVLQNDDVKSVFTQLGGLLFPKVKDEFKAVAGAVAAYSPDYVMKVQNAMNTFLVPTPALAVDGHYGKLTREAVEAFQKQEKLEVVDGWAGDKTLARIQELSVKHAAAAAATPAPTMAVPQAVKP